MMHCIRNLSSYSQTVRCATKALQSLSEKKPLVQLTLSTISRRNHISTNTSSVLIARCNNVNNGLLGGPTQHRKLSTLLAPLAPSTALAPGSTRISRNCILTPPPTASIIVSSLPPSRSVTKWSLSKGKRKTVHAVLRRFKRLDWGMWVRPRQGASKKLWKKSPKQRLRIKEHVFTNATQSTLLDKMVTRYWRKSRHYPDDPYAPYHQRPNFRLANSKPMKK